MMEHFNNILFRKSIINNEHLSFLQKYWSKSEWFNNNKKTVFFKHKTPVCVTNIGMIEHLW